ncbi:MAG: hypothetical protein KGP14_06910 [Betaproteobacteria bacterium]|nr:hypothetical protein [Betaproteobacteria bacterium]
MSYYIDFDGLRVPDEWDEYRVLDEDDGVWRMCGLLPRELPVGRLVPEWFETNETCPPIPRAQWQSTPDMRPYEWHNRYQNGYPACCLCSICGAVEFLLARDGREKTPLDWHRLWVETTGGRGGCAVDSALWHAMTQGIPIKNSTDRILVTEAWDVPTLEGFASGIQAGAMAVGCHDVHAECVVGLEIQNGTPYVQMVNSHYHGEKADRNWHLFRLDRIELRAYGAMLIREVQVRTVGQLIDAKG